VTFDPDASFFGTVSTPARYVIADGFNQFASALITPTIGPKATPDTLSLAAGATASFRTITGVNGIATGTNLNTSRTYLCGAGQTAPNCTETSTVTVAGVGVYTLNQTTGVVTLVADVNATAGTKASLTYVVTDSTGMTASSTLTPTIPAPTPPPTIPAPTPAPEPTPPPVSAAIPDTTTNFKGVVQSINVLANDKPGTGLTLDATTLKFCGLGQQAPNCTATSVSIVGQGTYSVGLGGVVTFTPESNFVGTATSLPYVVKDSYGRTVNSTYTPIVRDTPSASPDNSSGPFQQVQKLSILGNDTASTGTNLVPGTVRLCSKTETPPNCSSSFVEIENQGVFLLGADGVVTFTPTKTFTGTATTISYQVADSSGQIASSTITVTVGPPPPNPPKAVDDVRTTPLNVAISLDPATNDIAGSFPLIAKTVRLCTASEAIGQCTSTTVKNATGIFVVDIATGKVTFTPVPGWYGVTKVPYIVQDSKGQIAPAYITIMITPPAYLKLKELAWTGPTSTTYSHKKIVIPASSVGSGRKIATLRIPRLGSNWQQTVLDGIDQTFLAKGVGYYPGTALPGAVGNFVVAGHRMTQKQQFRDLDQLIVGDPIAVQVGNKIYLYKVVASKIVKPSDVSQLYPVPGKPGSIATKAILTLTTCNPKNSAKERLVVNAVLSSVLDAESAPAQYKAKA
jgi:LPXTG-site transpeptidase (sortase) family protein